MLKTTVMSGDNVFRNMCDLLLLTCSCKQRQSVQRIKNKQFPSKYPKTGHFALVNIFQ